ncbi:MAG: hypothetical protein OXC99_10640 [Chloroflexi bacterium]|nr:hypothetical protein [Chloroflexota bacterium]
MTRPRGRGALERALRRLRPRFGGLGWAPPRFGPDAELTPVSAFDVQMRERVRGLEEGLKEVKDRVNGLIFLVVGAVVVQVVLRFVA